MLAYPAKIVAADISVMSLNELRKKNPGNPNLDLLQLNGIDLSMIEDASIDMLATYSVLHHLPDYVQTVEEFCRVVKPGGVIYIDHECAPQVWTGEQGEYRNYVRELGQADHGGLGRSLSRKAAKLFSATAWRTVIDRTLFGLNDEGDIHVTPDDHVEWEEVERVLSSACEPVLRSDYLLCRGSGQMATIHRKFDGTCADMRGVIYRKSVVPG
jgi:SAM-dependent methyltransferase